VPEHLTSELPSAANSPPMSAPPQEPLLTRDDDEKLIVGLGPLAAFLTEQGYPISKSTVSKYCSPAINTGPPLKGYWGRLPAFSPSLALAWARGRLRPPNEAREEAAAK
jgi:hypothetical protein